MVLLVQAVVLEEMVKEIITVPTTTVEMVLILTVLFILEDRLLETCSQAVVVALEYLQMVL
jgi:hypothetical protein